MIQWWYILWLADWCAGKEGIWLFEHAHLMEPEFSNALCSSFKPERADMLVIVAMES
ncbi:MAG: hypothetical protein IJ324_03455 [Lachnospiraceae bacterium]|nr:hypothetical protein [Lachnospiraceae bacterium]